MKHAHMLFGVLSLLAALVTAVWVLVQAKRLNSAPAEPATNLGSKLPESNLPESKFIVPKGLIISSHALYAVTLALGLTLMFQAEPSFFFMAKLILLMVMASSLTKAAKAGLELKQRIAGLVIADVAWIGIVSLILTKPALFFA